MLNRMLRLLRALAVLGVCAVALQLDSTGERRTIAPGGLTLIEQDIRIFGPANRYTIATHIVRPQAPGRVAAVILNHGAGATAREPAGLAAVLAFAAGMGGDPQAHPETPCAPGTMAELFAHMGQHVKAPVLLNYAQNDRFFGVKSSQLWFERFRSGGGSAEYVLLPSFGADGHFVFTDAGGARYWVPVAEAFLRRHGLPFNRLVGA